MENEMIDRVALRIAAMTGYMHQDGWAAFDDLLKAKFRDMANSVISVMREPTEVMLTAACEVGPDTNSGCFDYDSAKTVYGAMIEATLVPIRFKVPA